MRWVTFMYGIAYLPGESHTLRNFSTLRRTSIPSSWEVKIPFSTAITAGATVSACQRAIEAVGYSDSDATDLLTWLDIS